MDKIEFRKIGSLRLHPDNVKIFGLPTDEANYEEIREDIRRRGLQEPLIILDDGTILSGHIRYSGVCWTLEQSGLTSDQIKGEMIAVRVHENFESKEEELEYLMSANDKRRQLDPRRMATSLERMEQIIEASEQGKKGKKGEALKRLADRLGVTFKLATTYRIIFSSKIVPEDYKDKVNSKSLATSTVIEAIKFAEESAKRESRAPSAEDVVIYLKTPRAKTTLSDTIREAAKGSISVATSTPTPKPNPAPVVVPAPTQTPAKAPVVTVEAAKAPEPPTVEGRPLRIGTIEGHIEKCCVDHGCKYADPNCPVALGTHKPKGGCEMCGLESEGYFDDHLHDDDDHEEEPETPAERITTARRLLKEALKVIVLDETVTSVLIGLHTELTSYLTAMNLISHFTAVPQQGLAIPTDATEVVTLCISLLQGMGEVTNPQDTRDALADLATCAQATRGGIQSTAKRGLEPNGLYCPECLEPQLNSPSGDTCSKGHGGCTGITKNQAEQIKLSQELSAEKFKCCFCGSQVETADSYATHANCPKCGLVDTSDIEPVIASSEPKKDDELDIDLLDEVLSSEPSAPALTPSTSTDISADELATLLGQEEPTKAPEPKKVEPKKTEPKKVEPKKAPVAQAKSNGAEDLDSFVSAVIDDFELELQKVGVSTTA